MCDHGGDHGREAVEADPGPAGLASAVQEAFADADAHGDGFIQLSRHEDGSIECLHLDPDTVVVGSRRRTA